MIMVGINIFRFLLFLFISKKIDYLVLVLSILSIWVIEEPREQRVKKIEILSHQLVLRSFRLETQDIYGF
jgi:hypothetical protein